MGLKEIIVDRFAEIKAEEQGFVSEDWKMVFFAVTDAPAAHISEVDFEQLPDEDFVRCFEYVIKMSELIRTNRVNSTYFK